MKSTKETENPDDLQDSTVILEKYIQILATDDERLTIIGEEISNSTGRQVLCKLFEGVSSVSEISSTLDISMSLTHWHIQRMLKVKMINETHIKFSKKNKKIKHYAPAKLALVIIPANTQDSEIYPHLVKHTLKKIYKHLAGFVTFITSTAITHNIFTSQQNYQMTDTTSDFNIPFEIILSLVIGISIGFGTWISLKIYGKKYN